MLEIQQIRLNKKQLAEKLLKVRKADFSKELNEAFRIDELKRNTQQKLDDNKASLNKLSAEIGKLFKEGNHKLANEIKSETGVLKEQIKKLKDDFGQLEIQLNEVLYQILIFLMTLYLRELVKRIMKLFMNLNLLNLRLTYYPIGN